MNTHAIFQNRCYVRYISIIFPERTIRTMQTVFATNKNTNTVQLIKLFKIVGD